MSARILVERLPNGFYKASHGANWAEWNPADGPGRAHGNSTPAFRRELARLNLGLGCKSCTYLEVEHHIDGDERAPCNEFVDPDALEGT